MVPKCVTHVGTNAPTRSRGQHALCLGEVSQPAPPHSQSQTHLCHGGRWVLQNGLRQELLCEVTGHWGRQGSLGKRRSLLTDTASGPSQRFSGVVTQWAYRRPFHTRVKSSLLEGTGAVFRGQRWGSRLAQHAGGPRARSQHHSGRMMPLPSHGSLSELGTSHHFPPLRPVLDSILGGFGCSSPILINS